MKRQLLEQFLTDNIDAAFRFAYTYTKNREDAEDVVSESMMKALHASDSLRDAGSVKPWFYRIVANTAISLLRQRKRESFTDYEEVAELEGREDDYSRLTMASLVETLDVRYRSVIVLRFFEDMKIKEIAQVLELNENTVKTRLYAGLKLLRIEMEGTGDGSAE